MNCQEITQIPVVQEAFKNPENRRLLNAVFACIYKLYCTDFINWMMAKNEGLDLAAVREMAEDAFQSGLEIFYSKTKETGLQQKASLRTVIFTFARWQFMALRNKFLKKHTVPLDETVSVLEEYTGLSSDDVIGEDREYWDDVLKVVLSEKEYQLHQAIRMLKKEWHKVLYWFYFDKLKPAQIAARMNVSTGHVNNILTEARKALKEKLVAIFNF